MKTSMTQAERLQLIGLLALATHHNKALIDITKAAAALLDAGPVDAVGNIDLRNESGRDVGGHITDAIYSGSREPDELLRLLGIAVEPGATP